MNRASARVALQRLRDAGFLVQHGKRGGATYVLERSLQPPAGLRLGRAELEDLVFQMAHEGPLTNAEVRARTGLERLQALDLLSKLVADGRLIRVGEKRGTRYVFPRATS